MNGPNGLGTALRTLLQRANTKSHGDQGQKSIPFLLHLPFQSHLATLQGPCQLSPIHWKLCCQQLRAPNVRISVQGWPYLWAASKVEMAALYLNVLEQTVKLTMVATYPIAHQDASPWFTSSSSQESFLQTETHHKASSLPRISHRQTGQARPAFFSCHINTHIISSILPFGSQSL